jgi:hypothetical protein
MLFREQAIEILKKYAKENKTFVIQHAFPYEIFDTEFNEDDWLIESNITVWKDIFIKEMRYSIEKCMEKVFIIKQSIDETIIVTDSLNYIQMIVDLQKAQEAFDLIRDNENDLATFIKHTSFIQETENKIIDKAEIILKLEQAIKKTIEEFKLEAVENYKLL